MHKLQIENAPLTPMAKKALCEIVYNAFRDKQTIFDAAVEERKEGILDHYKKAVNFEKMLSDYEQAKAEVDIANKKVKDMQEKINRKGLTVEGQQYQPYGYGYSHSNPSMKRSLKKVEKLLAVAESQGPSIQRDKIISSIWCANTTYEGQNLIASVLGSGEPMVDVADTTLKLTHKG